MRYNMYLEIDTLLDTRFNLIQKLSPSLAEHIGSDATYITRKDDTFLFLDKSVFKIYYKNRQRDLLTIQRPTVMRDIFIDQVIKHKSESFINGLKGPIEVFFNVYPYILSSIEKQTLISGMQSMVPKDVDIILMDEPLTKDFIKDKEILTVMKYDGLEWMEEEVKNNRLTFMELTDTLLIVPNVYHTDKKSVDKMMNLIEPYIRIEFSDPALWSTVDQVMLFLEDKGDYIPETGSSSETMEKEEINVPDYKEMKRIIMESRLN